jgi:hypothetical protein
MQMNQNQMSSNQLIKMWVFKTGLVQCKQLQVC